MALCDCAVVKVTQRVSVSLFDLFDFRLQSTCFTTVTVVTYELLYSDLNSLVERLA